MLTKEEHERLARVGPGTPMGELLRRYWHPVAATADLDQDPVRPVRLLGENLVLYRDETGTIGLVAERCAHRGISLAYGIPQTKGLRCAYHGWIYDEQGHVVDMPFEPACLPLKIQAYRVQELGGLVFAYLGPEPAPLLPRYDLFVRDDLNRNVEITMLPCNWLQCMDNSLDPIHFEHLHGVYGNYVMKRTGKPPMLNPARHLKIDFDVFEYGIIKRRLVEGEPEDCDDWTTGHPILFPNILSVGDVRRPNYQIRVPVDDTHTLHVRYQGILRRDGVDPRDDVPVQHLSLFDEDGHLKGWADDIPSQDMLAWVGQGPVSDRTAEHLATSDRGVALYHKLLFDNIERIERGEEPMAVVRDERKNFPMIQLPRENRGYRAFFTVNGEYREPVRPGARG
ncbi:MAG TPA: Rieske 2Fe-2S domain-containing protein [Chloroflexota bacterium]|nr:Rieske 2Fe-2S domain-containing protein [Chloroflexota bacterium]